MGTLKRDVSRTLSRYGSYSLDSQSDREEVTKALVRLFDRLINKSLCMRCGHLDEVHTLNECIAGPETTCGCRGFTNP